MVAMDTHTQTDALAPVAVDGVDPLHVLGEEFRPLVAGRAFEIIDGRGPEGTGPPPHHHPWDEAYVVLDGELEVEIDGAVTRLPAGSAAHVPADALHRYTVVSPEARWITTTSPAGAVAFFADVDASVAGPDDLPALVAAARRNQVESPLFPR